MDKTGMVVTYWPLPAERPMWASRVEAALITAWDEAAETATLAIFPPGREFFSAKYGVAEGTVPGTFQQPATPEPPPLGDLEIKPTAARPHGGQSDNKEKIAGARAKHHPG